MLMLSDVKKTLVISHSELALDVLLERKPHVENASCLLVKVETGEIVGYLCATTVTTLDYLMQKALGKAHAKVLVKKLLQLFEISPVNRLVLEGALDSEMVDFEDSVLHESALHTSLDGIVTRDKTGYKQAKLPVYTPQELLILL